MSLDPNKPVPGPKKRKRHTPAELSMKRSDRARRKADARAEERKLRTEAQWEEILGAIDWTCWRCGQRVLSVCQWSLQEDPPRCVPCIRFGYAPGAWASHTGLSLRTLAMIRRGEPSRSTAHALRIYDRELAFANMRRAGFLRRLEARAEEG
jgi:hypothetical protein